MKLDNLGNSPAFFFSNNKKLINKESLQKILKYSKKNNIDARICLHEKPFKGTQYMIICKQKKTKEKLYKHNKKKLFFILKGKIQISFLKTKIILSPKKNICFLLDKNIASKTKSLTNNSIYLEVMSKN